MSHLRDPDFASRWKEFQAHRKSLKKPMTERAEKAIIKLLQGFSCTTAIAGLDEAMDNGWLKPPKERLEALAREDQSVGRAAGYDPLEAMAENIGSKVGDEVWRAQLRYARAINQRDGVMSNEEFMYWDRKRYGDYGWHPVKTAAEIHAIVDEMERELPLDKDPRQMSL